MINGHNVLTIRNGLISMGIWPTKDSKRRRENGRKPTKNKKNRKIGENNVQTHYN